MEFIINKCKVYISTFYITDEKIKFEISKRFEKKRQSLEDKKNVDE